MEKLAQYRKCWYLPICREYILVPPASELWDVNRDFCNVCRETLIEKIHTVKNPIDSFTPSNSSAISTNQNLNLNVNLILPIPNTLKFEWKLNNSVIASDIGNLTIEPSQLNMGTNILFFSAYDNTAMVITNNHNPFHLSTISWTINKTRLGISDLKSR